MASWIRQLLDGNRGGDLQPDSTDEGRDAKEVSADSTPQQPAPTPAPPVPTPANRIDADRRRSPRIPLQLQVRLRFTSAQAMTTCRTFDISKTGAFIELRNGRPPGTRVRLTLQIGSRTLVVGGVVMRSSDGSDGNQPGMGIKFTELTADAAEHLAQLLDK